jgi:hypothetical protein
MTSTGPWRWIAVGELLAVVAAFALGRSVGGSPPPVQGPRDVAPAAQVLEPSPPPLATRDEDACDPSRRDTAQARIDELLTKLERPERRLAAIHAEHPELSEPFPSFAAEEDPSLYEPERLRQNLEDLYRACGRMDDWLGYDCSEGYCRVLALRSDERWSDCEAHADWVDLYSKWSTLHSFTIECDDGSSLPVVFWGPSHQPGKPTPTEAPDCEGLDAAGCEDAIAAYWDANWEAGDEARSADEALARELGCKHAL